MPIVVPVPSADLHCSHSSQRVCLCLQVMGKNKILVKVHPEGKYVVDLHKDIDIAKVTTGARVALRNDSYTLHLLLPTKVDPLVSLMKVEKVPDSTYDMIGGLDQQIKEIKEVSLLYKIVLYQVAPCIQGHVRPSDLGSGQEGSLHRQTGL